MKLALKIWMLCLAAVIFGLSATVWAQPGLFDGNQGGGLPGLGVDTKDIVKLNAQFTLPAGKQPAMLFITAEIKQGWHIYSITQAPGGPITNENPIGPIAAVSACRRFSSRSRRQKRKPSPTPFGDLVIESHYGSVTWYAPLELAAGVDPANLKIDGKITVQPCDANACLPPQDIAFSAMLGKGVELLAEQMTIAEMPRRRSDR